MLGVNKKKVTEKEEELKSVTYKFFKGEKRTLELYQIILKPLLS